MTLAGHNHIVTCLAFTPNCDYLVTGSKDKTAIIWNLKEGGIIEKVLTGHTKKLTCIRITANSEFLFTSSSDSTVIIWSLKLGIKQKVLTGHSRKISCLAISNDLSTCATASENGKAIIWDVSMYAGSYLNRSNGGVELIRYGNVMINQKYANIALAKGKESYREEFNNIITIPYNINILHMFAYENKSDLISNALDLNCYLVKSIFSESPITIALRRNSRGCLDALLIGITQFEDKFKIKYTLDVISQDIPKIIETGSKHLVAFLEFLFNQLDPIFIDPKEDLPIRLFSNLYDPDISNFKSQDTQNTQEDIKSTQLVEIAHTRLKWNFQQGSIESIQLLESIYNSPSQEIYRTDLVRSIIDLKWSQQYTINLSFTTLYLINLLFLSFIIFHEDIPIPLETLSVGFILVNLLFFIYEIYQALVIGGAYFQDIWNYIDIVRCPLCILIGVQGFFEVTPDTDKMLTALTVFICWIRGITYFRTFKYTRIFVNMILSAVRDTSSFLIIILYTTIPYATLFKISEVPEERRNLVGTLTLAYEQALSSFDTEKYSAGQWIIFILASIINCIIMLNLLISILGDSYERVQVSLVESDYSQMLEVIIELEKLMIWNRYKGSAAYLHQCGYPDDEYSQDEWEGKIRVLQDTISGVGTLIETKLKQVEQTQKAINTKLITMEQTQNGTDVKINEICEMLRAFTRASTA
jgi:hypothetical protein